MVPCKRDGKLSMCKAKKVTDKRVVSVCRGCGARLYECPVCKKLYAKNRIDQTVCSGRCRTRKARSKRTQPPAEQ